MRSLTISIVALALVLGAWGIFAVQMQEDLGEMQHTIGEELIPQLQQGEWPEAKKNFLYIKEVWDSHHDIYLLFLNGDSISQIQQCIVRLEANLHNQESAAAITELYSIREQLWILHKNEMPTIENIF